MVHFLVLPVRLHFPSPGSSTSTSTSTFLRFPLHLGRGRFLWLSLCYLFSAMELVWTWILGIGYWVLGDSHWVEWLSGALTLRLLMSSFVFALRIWMLMSGWHPINLVRGLCFYRSTCIIHSAAGLPSIGGTEVNRNLWVALLTPLITNYLYCPLQLGPQLRVWLLITVYWRCPLPHFIGHWNLGVTFSRFWAG